MKNKELEKANVELHRIWSLDEESKNKGIFIAKEDLSYLKLLESKEFVLDRYPAPFLGKYSKSRSHCIRS